MKRLILISVFLLAGVLAFCALQDGTWVLQGSVQNAPQRLVLQVSGASMTGTLDGVAISNGRVEGKFFWFQAVRGGITYSYKGTVSGNQLDLNETLDQQVRRYIFTRSAA